MYAYSTHVVQFYLWYNFFRTSAKFFEPVQNILNWFDFFFFASGTAHSPDKLKADVIT